MEVTYECGNSLHRVECKIYQNAINKFDIPSIYFAIINEQTGQMQILVSILYFILSVTICWNLLKNNQYNKIICEILVSQMLMKAAHFNVKFGF